MGTCFCVKFVLKLCQQEKIERRVIMITTKKKSLWTEMKKNKFNYFLLLPSIVLVVIFAYLPFGGIKIAFQDYNIYRPEASEWVGFDNFISVFSNDGMLKAIINTIYLSILNLIICFPLGIVFAVLLNEVPNGLFKKSVQTISYLPHFLSWISVIGIITTLLSKSGIINDLRVMLGASERVMFLSQQGLFVPLLIILTAWKEMGWGSIIYLAAISGIDSSLYEAATIDGAGKFRQMWHITLPSILPTIVIMLIMKMGTLFTSNFELVYGLQNAFIDFETINTIIYKQGIEGGDYASTTAFGLAQGVINFALILFTNYFSKKTTETGLF